MTFEMSFSLPSGETPVMSQANCILVFLKVDCDHLINIINTTHCIIINNNTLQIVEYNIRRCINIINSHY